MKNEKIDKWAGIGYKDRASQEFKSVVQKYDAVEREGKLYIIYPWGQELEADGSSAFFWGEKEELLKNLNADGVKRFIEYKQKNFPGEPLKMTEFCVWVKEQARQAQIAKEDARMAEIEKFQEEMCKKEATEKVEEQDD